MKFFVAVGLLVSVFVVDAGVSMHNQFFCYSTDPIRPMIRLHSTRTAYEAVRRAAIDPNASTCTSTPSRLWYFSRHSGRHPDAAQLQPMLDFANSSIIADIINNYDAGRTTLCRQDFEAIRDWTIHPNFTMENSDLGTAASIITARNIARNYQNSFPTLLTENYSPDRFFFRYTDFSQTNITMRAFVSGLFAENQLENVVYEDVPEYDSFMWPSRYCPSYSEEIADLHQVVASFRQGPEFEEMLEQVNRKLGFRGSNQLSVDTVLTIYEMCKYETGITIPLSDSEIGENIAMCSPFSPAHFILLEYYDSLIYYFGGAYGIRNQRFLVNLNCRLVQDFLTHMQSNNNTDRPVRVFVGSVSGNISPLFVTFGLFRDTLPLNQHNFAQQINRKWLTSVILPDGANLAVIRYDCADGDHDLLFLVNERPVLIQGCGENGICKLSFILNRLQRFIDANCDELFCSSD